jgi:hypothetical protein
MSGDRDNSILRMARRRDEAGHHGERQFADDVSHSPMDRMGRDGVASGLVAVSGFKGNMQQRPRDAGHRPSGTVPKEYLGIRAPVEIQNSQGMHAIGFPPDLLAGTCPDCSNEDAARRAPAEPSGMTLALRHVVRA